MLCSFVSRLVLFRQYAWATFALLSLNGIFATSAFSAGFALSAQSGTGLGNAFAGMTATSQDASNQFYNPASLSFLSPERQISAGGMFILPNVEFKDGTASNVVLGTPVTGGDGGNAGSPKFTQNFYLASEQFGKFRYGLGVTAPYGLGNAYNKGWMGRYHADESRFRTIDINPAFSYQLTDRISLGLGLSIQYAQLKTKSGIDSSAICLYSAPPPACAAIGLGRPGNATVDSYAELEGNDISGGFNMGIMFKATSALSLGLAYRSAIEHEIEGDAEFDLSGPMTRFVSATRSTSFRDSHFQSRIKLPEQLTFGMHYKPNEDWDLLADIALTGWSRFETVEVEFDNPGQPSAKVNHDWNDSWRVSLGATRRLNDKWKFKTGLSYDRTPIPSASLRTAVIPDADRITLAMGLTREINKKMRAELAYAHLFGRDAEIRTTNATGHALRGDMDISADLIAFQLIRKF